MTKAGSKILLGIVLFLFGILVLVLGIQDNRGITGEAIDLNEIEYDSLEKGQYVKGDVSIVVDYYCEEVNKKYGITTGKSRWYLVSFSNDQEEWHYVGVKVDDSMFDDYEEMCNQYYDAATVNDLTKTLLVQGKVCECTGDVEKYRKEYAEEAQDLYRQSLLETYDQTDVDEYFMDYSIDDMCVPYYITLTSTGSTYFAIVAGIVMILLGLVLLILGIRAKRQQSDFFVPVSGSSMSGMSVNVGESSKGVGVSDDLDRVLEEENRKYQEDMEKKRNEETKEYDDFFNNK